jgi:hypothetical protein
MCFKRVEANNMKMAPPRYSMQRRTPLLITLGEPAIFKNVLKKRPKDSKTGLKQQCLNTSKQINYVPSDSIGNPGVGRKHL